MTYEDAITSAFAFGSVSDGYCGDRCPVSFALSGGEVWIASPQGCFRAGIAAASEAEAMRELIECSWIELETAN